MPQRSAAGQNARRHLAASDTRDDCITRPLYAKPGRFCTEATRRRATDFSTFTGTLLLFRDPPHHNHEVQPHQHAPHDQPEHQPRPRLPFTLRHPVTAVCANAAPG